MWNKNVVSFPDVCIQIQIPVAIKIINIINIITLGWINILQPKVEKEFIIVG